MIKSKSRLTHADRVFQYLKNKNQPLSAYDILEGMRSEGVAAATTIYRALDKLFILFVKSWSRCSLTYPQSLHISNTGVLLL